MKIPNRMAAAMKNIFFNNEADFDGTESKISFFIVKWIPIIVNEQVSVTITTGCCKYCSCEYLSKTSPGLYLNRANYMY